MYPQPPPTPSPIVITRTPIAHAQGIYDYWVKKNKEEPVDFVLALDNDQNAIKNTSKKDPSETPWIIEYTNKKGQHSTYYFTLKETETEKGKEKIIEKEITSFTFHSTKENLKEKIEEFLSLLYEAYSTTYSARKENKKLVLSPQEGECSKEAEKIFKELIEKHKDYAQCFEWKGSKSEQQTFLPQHNLVGSASPEKPDLNVMPQGGPSTSPSA